MKNILYLIYGTVVVIGILFIWSELDDIINGYIKFELFGVAMGFGIVLTGVLGILGINNGLKNSLIVFFGAFIFSISLVFFADTVDEYISGSTMEDIVIGCILALIFFGSGVCILFPRLAFRKYQEENNVNQENT